MQWLAGLAKLSFVLARLRRGSPRTTASPMRESVCSPGGPLADTSSLTIFCKVRRGCPHQICREESSGGVCIRLVEMKLVFVFSSDLWKWNYVTLWPHFSLSYFDDGNALLKYWLPHFFSQSPVTFSFSVYCFTLLSWMTLLPDFSNQCHTSILLPLTIIYFLHGTLQHHCSLSLSLSD